ncbi:unnamed protein product [Closterium sp. Naga37s-1]|nr:unnamed protein product [Closterium sp. Naga37s-1]
MASSHNPDHVMAEEQIPVGDDTLNELDEDYLVDDLPDGALPELPEDAQTSLPVGAQPTSSGEPAAKKQCSEGQSSAAATATVSTGAPSAPLPIPRASSSGSTDAAAPTHTHVRGPSGPRTAPASRARPQPQAHVAAQVAAGPSSTLAPTVRHRNLRRHRSTVGAVLQSLTRNTQSLVDIIFPESSGEEARAAVALASRPCSTQPPSGGPRLLRSHPARAPPQQAHYLRGSASVRECFSPAHYAGFLAPLPPPPSSPLPWICRLLPLSLDLFLPPPLCRSGRIIGQQAAPAAFKKDPGLLLIGVDLDVEVWTYSLCDFDCGLALDSAMYHINSDLHRNRMQETAHLPAVKDKYGAWKAATLLQHPHIFAFLQ